MAEKCHEVITMEPAQQENPATYQQDENGEEILMEGVFAKRRFYCDLICFNGVITYAIAYFLAIPILLCMGYFAAKRLRLYLTPSGITYSHPVVCSCCRYHFNFPLEDIDDVRYDPGKNMVLLHMESEKIKEYVNWCCRPICGQLQYFALKYVKNEREFANAVRRMLATRENTQ